MKKVLKTKPKIELSEKSTMLAAERTALSWIRTMLASLSVAFAFIKLDKQHPFDAVIISLFAFAFICLIGAIITLIRTKIFIKHTSNNPKSEYPDQII